MGEKKKTELFLDTVREHLQSDAVTLSGLDFDGLLIFNEVDYTWIPLRHPSQLSEDCQVYVPRDGQQLPAEFPPVERKSNETDWWKVAMAQEPSKLIATILSIEYAGSFVLSFMSTANIVYENSPTVTFQSAGIINAIVILVILLSFGENHTPQLNPIATLALLLRRKIPIWLAVLSFIIQILGCVAGVALAFAVTEGGSPDADISFRTAASVVQPGWAKGQAAIVEITASFFISFIVLKHTKDHEDPFRHSRPRSCTLQGAIAISGSYYVPTAVFSRVHPNTAHPARAFAMAIVLQDRSEVWENLWIFIVFPICGCLISAVAHQSIPSTRGVYKSVADTVQSKRHHASSTTKQYQVIQPAKTIFINGGMDQRIGVKLTSDSRHFEIISSLSEWSDNPQCWVTDTDGTLVTLTYDTVTDGSEYSIKKSTVKNTVQSPVVNVFGSAHSLVRTRH